MKTLLASLVLLLTASCASVSVEGLPPIEDLKHGGIAVELEFDRIHLADTIKFELLKHGYMTSDSRERARFLWTGSYSSSHDVSHERFDWAQFKLIDMKTKQTASQLQVGQGGLNSVEDVIAEMIRKLGGEKDVVQQRPD